MLSLAKEVASETEEQVKQDVVEAKEEILQEKKEEKAQEGKTPAAENHQKGEKTMEGIGNEGKTSSKKNDHK